MRMKSLLVALGIAVFGVLVGLLFVRYLNPLPPALTASATGTTQNNSQVVNIKVSTWGAAADAEPGHEHPNWVIYYPTTVFKVPAYATVHMEIDQEDSATGLRNEWLGLVRGVSTTDSSGNQVQNAFSVQTFDKKSYVVQAVGVDGSLVLANGKKVGAGDGSYGPAHTFTIPDLGVSVPLMGVANADQQFNAVTFDFKVPGPGIYRWQCFVPCGAGTLYGNGGPMQTLGYMDGEFVVS